MRPQPQLMLLLAALLLSSASQGASQAYDPAAPWTAPPGTDFPYKRYVNDLEGLLRLRAKDNWVTLMAWTSALKRMGMNCFYSLANAHLGDFDHYIIAAFENETLAVCDQLNLPCFDARIFKISEFGVAEVTNGVHNYFSLENKAMTWAKPIISAAINKMGYNVHLTDVDVVYFRSVNLTYNRIFKEMDPDGIWLMEESQPSNYLLANPDLLQLEIEKRGNNNLYNVGVFALQHNERTVNFMAQWLDIPLIRIGTGQVFGNQLHTVAFDFCDTYVSCLSVKKRGLAAFWRHPTLFPKMNSCIQPKLEPTECDPRRLYLHYLCGPSWDNKLLSWEALHMWLVDEHGHPMYQNLATGVQAPHERHPFFPCAERVAWTGAMSEPR